MNERDALDICQQAIWTIIVASGPAVGAAMFVGVVIALLQALTQVQEMTLTFTPRSWSCWLWLQSPGRSWARISSPLPSCFIPESSVVSEARRRRRHPHASSALQSTAMTVSQESPWPT